MDTKLSDMEKDLIIAFAKYDMRPYRVAKNFYVCKATITYHVKKIKEKTGLDMRKFYDLCKLLEIINERGAFHG